MSINTTISFCIQLRNIWALANKGKPKKKDRNLNDPMFHPFSARPKSSRVYEESHRFFGTSELEWLRDDNQRKPG